MEVNISATTASRKLTSSCKRLMLRRWKTTNQVFIQKCIELGHVSTEI